MREGQQAGAIKSRSRSRRSRSRSRRSRSRSRRRQGRTKFVIWQLTTLENTAHIISDWTILAILSQTGKY